MENLGGFTTQQNAYMRFYCNLVGNPYYNSFLVPIILEDINKYSQDEINSLVKACPICGNCKPHTLLKNEIIFL